MYFFFWQVFVLLFFCIALQMLYSLEQLAYLNYFYHTVTKKKKILIS